MGVPPEWMVCKGKTHPEMDDLIPPFEETPICCRAAASSSRQRIPQDSAH